MLELEEKIRFSKPYIECTNMRNVVISFKWKYSKKKIAHKLNSGLLHNTIACQYSHGRASLIYPDDPRFKNTSVYVRNNIARVYDFKMGIIFQTLNYRL